MKEQNFIEQGPTRFELKVTGAFFIAAAAMLWLGWVLLPHQLGEYIVFEDFTKVNEDLWYWIWMYRIHIFGWVTMGISLFALSALTAKRPYRVLIVPGAGMALVGTFTLALAAAYFYNHGAWGIGRTEGLSADEIDEFMNGLLYTNQYVTCFIRFGRIFSGVGLVILGLGFLKWNMLGAWLSWFTILLGLAAMVIILGIPDNFDVYAPIFHIKALWLLCMGLVIIRKGINLNVGPAV